MGKLLEERGKPQKRPSFPVGKSPAVFPGPDIRFELVLSGTLQVEDKSHVEAIVRHLQVLLQDPRLTLLEVRSGSIILQLQCSQAAFDRLVLKLAGGKPAEIMGIPIEEIRMLEGNSWEEAQFEAVGRFIERSIVSLDINPMTKTGAPSKNSAKQKEIIERRNDLLQFLDDDVLALEQRLTLLQKLRGLTQGYTQNDNVREQRLKGLFNTQLLGEVWNARYVVSNQSLIDLIGKIQKALGEN